MPPNSFHLFRLNLASIIAKMLKFCFSKKKKKNICILMHQFVPFSVKWNANILVKENIIYLCSKIRGSPYKIFTLQKSIIISNRTSSTPENYSWKEKCHFKFILKLLKYFFKSLISSIIAQKNFKVWNCNILKQ